MKWNPLPNICSLPNRSYFIQKLRKLMLSHNLTLLRIYNVTTLRRNVTLSTIRYSTCWLENRRRVANITILREKIKWSCTPILYIWIISRASKHEVYQNSKVHTLQEIFGMQYKTADAVLPSNTKTMNPMTTTF